MNQIAKIHKIIEGCQRLNEYRKGNKEQWIETIVAYLATYGIGYSHGTGKNTSENNLRELLERYVKNYSQADCNYNYYMAVHINNYVYFEILV